MGACFSKGSKGSSEKLGEKTKLQNKPAGAGSLAARIENGEFEKMSQATLSLANGRVGMKLNAQVSDEQMSVIVELFTSQVGAITAKLNVLYY
jgi:hypothetical protein